MENKLIKFLDDPFKNKVNILGFFHYCISNFILLLNLYVSYLFRTWAIMFLLRFLYSVDYFSLAQMFKMKEKYLILSCLASFMFLVFFSSDHSQVQNLRFLFIYWFQNLCLKFSRQKISSDKYFKTESVNFTSR